MLIVKSNEHLCQKAMCIMIDSPNLHQNQNMFLDPEYDSITDKQLKICWKFYCIHDITFTFWDIICDWCVALLQYFDTLSENFYWLSITLSPVKADRQLKSLFQSHITSRQKLCGKSRRHFVFVVSSFPKTRTSGDQIGFLCPPSIFWFINIACLRKTSS